MCTAAILPAHDGAFFAVFNRDELWSRGTAQPPAVTRGAGGVSIIAPRDPDGGGTWIAATSRGEVFGLLNNYRDAQHFRIKGPLTSRGVIIDWVSGRPDGQSVGEVLTERRTDLDLVRPFRLLVATPAGERAATCGEWTWTGRSLVQGVLELPGVAVSSGTRQEQAHGRRMEALSDLLGSDGGWSAVAQRMSQHLPEPGPMALCMHRVGAQTVSQTVVEVSDDAVVMRYKNGPPCVTGGWHLSRVARAPS